MHMRGEDYLASIQITCVNCLSSVQVMSNRLIKVYYQVGWRGYQEWSARFETQLMMGDVFSYKLYINLVMLEF